ncbi:MAG TPA: PQQ-binding-like beta-propeller repeat protein [Silvibacterium sp.]|nr:PQQ-binding-like beta-propeller repeat protein [Silvibacterium sp.]
MSSIPALRCKILCAAGILVVLTGCGTTGHLPGTSNEMPGSTGAMDFSITVSPSSLDLIEGDTGQMVAVTANALHGFSGSVSVSLNGLPAGVTATPSTLMLTPGAAQNIMVTADENAAVGDSTVTFTGSSGNLSHAEAVPLRVGAPDFSVVVSPTSMTLTAGGAAQLLAVKATTQPGFRSDLIVQVSGLPAGVTASPSRLVLPPRVWKNIVLTAAENAAMGTTTVTLTCAAGRRSHTATLALTVVPPVGAPDFSLTIAPARLTLTAGADGQPVAVTANPLNGFTAKVNVALSGLPAGVKAEPSTLTLTPGTAQNITLTADATAPPVSNTTVTFTGTSGDLKHSGTLQLTVSMAAAGVDVTTYHYDNARDGLNAHETTLTTANVNSKNFRKVDFFDTDGKVDAAPLYLSAMTLGGQTRNVLYVATEHDSVYAFDADTGKQLWKVSVLGEHEKTSDDHFCGQITPEIGITSTPVIDRKYGAHGAIFVVGMSVDRDGNYFQRLHALDLTTGDELSGGPTEIQATYPGTGAFSVNGMQTFVPGNYAERVGLLLMHGTIYLGWTSHCDEQPYTGWLMAYSETTLKQTSVLNLTPNSGGTGFGEGEGSIWMSGAGLAGDASGNIYFLDANGGFDTTLDGRGFPNHGDFGNAFMKVSTASGKLAVADYFNSSNTVMESDEDQDLGSGGVLLLPDQRDEKGKVHQLAVGAGKDRSIYVVDRNDMGKFNSVSNNIYQQLPGAIGGEWGMPAWFNGTVYYGGTFDALKAFSVVNAKLQTTPASQSPTSFGYPGTTPSVSSNGTLNGIVWAVENAGSAGILHAYDAGNLGNELYNSNEIAKGRDKFTDNKFITPVVANGKVFIGTTTGVIVFGLFKQ